MTSGKQGSLKYSGGDLISRRPSKKCWTFKEGEGFDGASVKRTPAAVHFFILDMCMLQEVLQNECVLFLNFRAAKARRTCWKQQLDLG